MMEVSAIEEKETNERSVLISMEPLPEKRVYKYLDTGEEVFEE